MLTETFTLRTCKRIASFALHLTERWCKLPEKGQKATRAIADLLLLRCLTVLAVLLCLQRVWLPLPIPGTSEYGK